MAAAPRHRQSATALASSLGLVLGAWLGCSGPSGPDTCRESCQCKTLGRCARTPSGTDQDCAPASDDDCKQSVGCRDGGYCKRDKLSCVVGSEDDCRASKLCQNLGACTLVDGKCHNTSPTVLPKVQAGVIASASVAQTPTAPSAKH